MLRKLFSGRIGRSEFLIKYLLTIGIILLIILILSQISKSVPSVARDFIMWGAPFFFAGFIYQASLATRRLRDVGWPTWLTLTMFINPLIAQALFIILIFIPSKKK